MATYKSSISEALSGNTIGAGLDAFAPHPPPPPTAAMDMASKHSGLGLAFDAGAAAAAAARGSQQHSTNNRHGLLTPPSSISPNLPEAFAAKFAMDMAASPPSQIDSDIDLHELHDHSAAIRDYDSKSDDDDDDGSGVGGTITPSYLAKYHLAELVLEKGPIAIRHVMNHLCATVPGFAQIAPPKARRITVAALEGKAGGGPDGNVEFEKVGWGRWDARIRGQPSREARAIHTIREDRDDVPMFEGAGSQHPQTEALRIPGNGRPRPKHRRVSHGSWTAESGFATSRPSFGASSMDLDVSESQADAMSIDLEDGPGLHQHSFQPGSAPFSRGRLDAMEESETDDEDWSSLGPEALRNSLGTSGPGRPRHFTTGVEHASRSRSRGWSPKPRSLPAATGHLHSFPRHRVGGAGWQYGRMDAQEKDAVAALLSMGSVQSTAQDSSFRYS